MPWNGEDFSTNNTCTRTFFLLRRMHRAFRPLVSSRVSARHAVCFARTSLSSTSSSLLPSSSLPLVFNDEVRDAVAAGKPVVALESTIISHGMPYPQNAETAVAVEKIVRDGGAVPATIAILDGHVHIGLTDETLDELARSGRSVQKCSRRDLPVVMAQKRHGATTVAATMYLAHLAGIDVFVTGGVGGVHRGAEDSMDVSADLTELGRTPVAVICAGVKSILDIPRTLEVLETQGVPVMTLDSVNGNFPAFFSPDSGVKSPYSVTSIEEAAAAVHASSQLQLSGGTVIAVPNPSPADSEQVEAAVQSTLREAEEQGIAGRDVTPFVLQRVNELTGGASLVSNIALVKHNAVTGTKIAVELNRLQQQQVAESTGSAGREHEVKQVDTYSTTGAAAFTSTSASTSSSSSSSSSNAMGDQRKVVVVGGATIDLVTTPSASETFQLGTSMPGRVRQSHGGVGRNIAECLARLGEAPLLIASVGADDFGRTLREACVNLGMPAVGLVEDPSSATAVYAAALDDQRELVTAVADMEVMHTLSPDRLRAFTRDIRGAELVVADGNLSLETTQELCALCDRYEENSHVRHHKKRHLWFEPTSVPKAVRGVEAGLLDCESLTYLSPNVEELRGMAEACGTDQARMAMAKNIASFSESGSSDAAAVEDAEIVGLSQHLIAHMAGADTKHVVVTRGAAGVLLVSATPSDAGTVSIVRLVPEPIDESIVNCTGAGDTLVGATVWALTRGTPLPTSIECGMRAARLSVMATEAVSHAICELTVA